jgi:serpin B
MTYAGARATTADQMRQTLRLTLDATQLHPMSASLMSNLNTREGYSLSVANALWGQSDFDFRPEFLSLTKEFYSAGFHTADFKTDAPREIARKDINAWVEDKTQQKIKDLLAPGILTAITRLVLVNAIYFKAAWLFPFEKALTKDADFTLSDNKKVKVPMMRQTKDFGYAETPDLQILKAPYVRDLAMYILLPKKPAALAGIEAGLTSDKLKALFSSTVTKEVAVSLPRFKIEEKYELNSVLKSMGMPDAFDRDKADFSGMAALNPEERLYISKVIHKAFVDVDEKGTEAAAATAIVMEKLAMAQRKPAEFKADHPFIFAICDNTTGSILFMGRLSDPRTNPN